MVTLAFAICWLPIHTLELLKYSGSSVFHNLLRSYPKVLYAIRAFTHALSYFNSCLNPYLYALLNRNFCFDLIDIMPTCFTHCTYDEIIQRKSSNLNTKPVSSVVTVHNDNPLSKRRDNDNDDDEDDDDEELFCFGQSKSTHVDVSCQAELLRPSIACSRM